MYEFTLRDGRTANVQLVVASSQINKEAARTLLSKSFIFEYQKYLQPADIDSKLKSWLITEGIDSVEAYYFDYFATEFAEFEHGKLFWLEAKIANQLIGWATYEKAATATGSHYMNLLLVDPEFQKQGVGKELVHAITKLNLDNTPAAKSINLLLRKTNVGGRRFYSSLGFKPNPNFKWNNYVDVSLLEGWTLGLA
jgi:GNAT superfamily N-acetyltransferase